jgi:hypothetical protein
MSRRYEPPSAGVTIQNSALASSPIVEISENCVMQEKRFYAKTTSLDVLTESLHTRTIPSVRVSSHEPGATWAPYAMRSGWAATAGRHSERRAGEGGPHGHREQPDAEVQVAGFRGRIVLSMISIPSFAPSETY